MGATTTNLGKFDHIVVLMLENHSLDSLAGYLYDECNPPAQFIGRGDHPYRGVAGKRLSNSVTTDDGTTISCSVAPAPFATQADMTNPFPDPGEVYSPHVNTQLFGSQDPPQSPTPPNMSGFVKDYYGVLKESTGWDGNIAPTQAHLQRIMNCYPSTDDCLPILSGLAQAFAISDEWFCSVPSQTFCNRSFFNSGSSHGFVSNSGGKVSYFKWLLNTQRTIFNALSDAGHDWRVYQDAEEAFTLLGHKHPVSLTRLIHWFPLLLHGDKFVTYEGTTNTKWTHNSFVEACNAGTLPEYTFIEPRWFLNHNDMHPPFAPLPHLLQPGPTVQSSILAGEWLVWNVYNAVMSGAKWDRTLLVITFDEHGGCYDHCPPPWGMIPPDDKHGEDGFGFNRLGLRVPTILISAYIDPRTVFRAPDGPFNPFDHTSMIKTIANRWGLTKSLGARADNKLTADISAVLTREKPRRQADLPTLTPRPYTPLDQPAANAAGLTGFQRDIFELIDSCRHGLRSDASAEASLAAAAAAADAPATVQKPDTVGEALEYLRALGGPEGS